MKNPWEEISLLDYECHMKLNTILQLQTINKMMKNQISRYSLNSIMILGIAGGNGLEHINPKKHKKVYGIDINNAFLKECTNRYENLSSVLECMCLNLTAEDVTLPYADMVIANLLIEYIGYKCFQNNINQIRPKYVSCIIQINADESFVSDSPYDHVFDDLSQVHHQIDEEGLIQCMKSINFDFVHKSSSSLPNNKSLIQLDFKH